MCLSARKVLITGIIRVARVARIVLIAGIGLRTWRGWGGILWLPLLCLLWAGLALLLLIRLRIQRARPGSRGRVENRRVEGRDRRKRGQRAGHMLAMRKLSIIIALIYSASAALTALLIVPLSRPGWRRRWPRYGGIGLRLFVSHLPGSPSLGS